MNELNMENSNVDVSNPPFNPWDNAPSNVYFYEKIYEDGHLGNFTQSAEMAYKMGWDIVNNYIPIENTDISDINGWTYRKEVCPHKTQEQIQQELVNQRIIDIQIAVQNLLDSKAKKKLYDDAFALASYATSTDETFRSEAQTFVAWRDRCWRKCYEILAQFESGEIEMPSVEYVMGELPVLEW